MQMNPEISQIIIEAIPDTHDRMERYVVDTSEVDDELLEIFLEQMQMNISAMERARASGDMEAAGNEAHSIKGMGGTAGMPELSVLAEDMEKAAKAEDLKHFDELKAALDAYFGQVRAFAGRVSFRADC